MNEEWRTVAGYEGLYEVSNHGRVKSLARVIVRRNGARLAIRERILKPHPLYTGHLHLSLFSGGRGWTTRVHVLVADAFVPGRRAGLEVRHLDGNPTNNFATNLAWGTRGENQLDQVQHGTHFFANKTHCPHGHPYSASNTYIRPSDGGRECRECRRRASREWYARKMRRLASNG